MTPQLKATVERQLKLRGRLALWTQMIGTKMLAAGAERTNRNLEAADAHARRSLYGDSAVADGEDMGDTILGDVNHNPRQGSSLMPVLLTALLTAAGVGGPIAGVAAYMLAQRPPQQQSEDTTANVGLGHIEDYINGNGGTDDN